MIEAFLLGLYIILLSPILLYFDLDDPILLFTVLMAISLPGIYAMFRGAPYLPTEHKRVQKMLDVAEIKKGDTVTDLGCGDGRIVFGAAKLGAKLATGYELSVPVYIWAKVKSFFYKNVDIRYKDFWLCPNEYKNFDVIFCFLLVKPMQKFEKEIWPQLKPGTKVVSNSFRLPTIKPSIDQDGIRVYVKE